MVDLVACIEDSDDIVFVLLQLGCAVGESEADSLFEHQPSFVPGSSVGDAGHFAGLKVLEDIVEVDVVSDKEKSPIFLGEAWTFGCEHDLSLGFFRVSGMVLELSTGESPWIASISCVKFIPVALVPRKEGFVQTRFATPRNGRGTRT